MARLTELARPFMRARVLWDVFMVWAALCNLYLIAFDLTYLWLRPLYFRHVLAITRLYDPVKGIESHPLTEELLEEVDATRALLDTDPAAPALAGHLAQLRELTARVVAENPFERSGQTAFFLAWRQDLARQLGIAGAAVGNPATLARALDGYWSAGGRELSVRLDRFDRASRAGFELNYFREFDRGGRLIDHFWIIDLPFLVLFWTEFLARWFIALRRHSHARWFFFPILNWYDLIGLIPNPNFRVFRLLRAASLYMRLRRSELSGVGRDAISRSVAYLSSIITEEVSDRVALRILSELEEEIADGTHARIVRAAFEPRRGELEAVVALQIRQILSDPETLERVRELLRLNLDHAVEQAAALRTVPLPGAILRPLVRFTGEVVLDTTIETIHDALVSESGERAVRDVASAVLDDLLSGPALVALEVLAREVGLDVIRHMKDVVAVKKWARPQPQVSDEGHDPRTE